MDSMREEFEKDQRERLGRQDERLTRHDGEYLDGIVYRDYEIWKRAYQAALTQQPESEPSEDENCPFCGGEVDPGGWLDGNGKRGPECEGCGATALSMEVWNRRIVSPQPSPQVPNGFNRLAYNRKTDEWLYINHAGEWQLCPCPVPQAAQVPEGWRQTIKAAVSHLSDWLDMDICECEQFHTCGRNEVAQTRGELQAFLAAPSIAEKRELTIDNAPVGTKAPSITGAHWIKTERGWRWCNSSVSFPRPGGDWNGELILPNDMQHSESSEIPNDQ